MKVWFVPLICALASCSNAAGEKDVLPENDASQLEYARAFITLSAPSGTKVLAMCGASAGKVVFVGPEKVTWEDDRISKGSFAFVQKNDGSVDYLFRDATGKLTSALQDGGTIAKTYQGENGEMMFLVSYGTGVAETYNVTKDLDGRTIVLWTSNKQANLMPAKVSAFLARCL